MRDRVRNLLLRAVSAVALGGIFIISLIWLGPLFDLLVVLFGCGAIYEWLRMTRKSRRFAFKLVGIVYIALTPWILVSLRREYVNGWSQVLALLLIVWGTDTGAYITGRLLGGPKFFPAISPNKTWAGAIGGFLSGIGVAAIGCLTTGERAALPLVIVISAQIAVATEAGDLIESAVKRRFQVKDSGWLIPGHGGILDRIDGLLLAAPVYAGWHYYLNHSGL